MSTSFPPGFGSRGPEHAEAVFDSTDMYRPPSDIDSVMRQLFGLVSSKSANQATVGEMPTNPTTAIDQ